MGFSDINMDESYEIVDLKPEKRVRFGNVTTLCFARAQGHVTVPAYTAGASSLGMEYKHMSTTVRSMDHEYIVKTFSACNRAIQQHRRGELRIPMHHIESMQKFMKYFSERFECRVLPDNQDTGFEIVDALIRKYKRLLPLNESQREMKLMKSEVRINMIDKHICENIRRSRTNIGCFCQGHCDPATCPCRNADVLCHKRVCKGCTIDSCGNEKDELERDAESVWENRQAVLERMEKDEEDEGWLIV